VETVAPSATASINTPLLAVQLMVIIVLCSPARRWIGPYPRLSTICNWRVENSGGLKPKNVYTTNPMAFKIFERFCRSSGKCLWFVVSTCNGIQNNVTPKIIICTRTETRFAALDLFSFFSTPLDEIRSRLKRFSFQKLFFFFTVKFLTPRTWTFRRFSSGLTPSRSRRRQ